MRFAKAGIVIAVAGVLSVLAGPVSADQYTSRIAADRQKQHQIDQTIASLRAEIAAAQTEEQALRGIITRLNTKIAATQAQISGAQQELRVITADLASARAQLAAARAQLAWEKRQLAHALVIIYEVQQQSTPLNNLLTSGNFNSFWTSIIDNRRISAQEEHMVTQIHQQQDVIQQEVDGIALKQEHQQAVLSELNGAEANLSSERNAQQIALAYLQRLEAHDRQLAQQWAAAYAALNGQISYLQHKEAVLQAARRAGGGHGQFTWPDSGPISQGFGCTPYAFEAYDPSCPTLHFHNGIDIAGACGNDIVAADAGVAYIQPYEPWGFGNYIIIVHGNGWTTLYGHMSGFAIGSGRTVRRGQLIGWEGTSGNSTGCHLHFGINHNGVWVNPLRYLG